MEKYEIVEKVRRLVVFFNVCEKVCVIEKFINVSLVVDSWFLLSFL